ncbi:3-oxo-tetronate kinase [Ancylobacter pratisalsi]|uniref:3-oxo-tetronate kinase n=1 Tax=Ancylobacter pratisalsi TaxID=1745854 RepID=A0A6P1YMK4_9HYPH|nr:3-oxo-tetronate kinase [Ancylobacter pratisalsi]QIB34588.1 four-carbon acid sugar kinase family protein [Ancylobacter pratisalsi]
MLLGCVADDLTGATDLALTLTREGLRTVQINGVPKGDLDIGEVDAVVVALKSRTNPAQEAVAQSLEAARCLRAFGARRLMFKYCSTFDSTDHGNIGPVAQALLDFAGGDFTVFCPAFPRAGRSLFSGYLFVNGVPINESPMKDHPLTPMRDGNLCRVLQRQTSLPVGLVAYGDVDAGPDAVAGAFARETAAGRRALILDAISDAHLRTLGTAIADLPLITGGSGIAMGLPAAYLKSGLINALTPAPTTIAAPAGRSIVLAGSCSAATRGQVARAIAAGMPALRLDPNAIAEGTTTPDTVLAWLDAVSGDSPALVYSSADPEAVKAVQGRLGVQEAGHMVEALLASVAAALPAKGYGRIIVAGGETAGAVVGALGASALRIGPEIDPGVPWTASLSGPPLALALKSGNFGGEDFFLKAWDRLR